MVMPLQKSLCAFAANARSAHDVVRVLRTRKPGTRALLAALNVAESAEVGSNVGCAPWTSSVFTMDDSSLGALTLRARCRSWARGRGSTRASGDELEPAVEGGGRGGGAHPTRPALGNVVCLVHLLQASTLVAAIVSWRQELALIIRNGNGITVDCADQTTTASPLHVWHAAVARTGLEFALDFMANALPSVPEASVLLDVSWDGWAFVVALKLHSAKCFHGFCWCPIEATLGTLPRINLFEAWQIFLDQSGLEKSANAKRWQLVDVLAQHSLERVDGAIVGMPSLPQASPGQSARRAVHRQAALPSRMYVLRAASSGPLTMLPKSMMANLLPSRTMFWP